MMAMVFLVFSGLVAVAGAFLLGDFLYWAVRGRVVRARITGWQDRKNKGLFLPRVIFKNENGEIVEGAPSRIDQFLYFLNRPGEGALTTLIHLRDDIKQVRIYGYINVVAGGALFLPLPVALGIERGAPLVLGQAAYVAILAVIILGGWALMKLIQRYY
jgi:hypothetical protein